MSAEQPMTRREQYEAFRPFFEAEEHRHSAITQRATVFLGLLSFVVLFGGDHLERLPKAGWQYGFSLATVGFVLLAVLSSIAALCIRRYKDICDIEVFIQTIEDEQYSEDDVYSNLLASMADAVQKNRNQNTVRARWVQLSAIFFASSIISTAIVATVL